MKPNRFYSKRQEKKVAEKIGGATTPNSGASVFGKGDVVGKRLLLECKTVVKPQKSISIQKEWLVKVQEEAMARGKEVSALAVDFGDKQGRYYVLSEMDFLLLYESYLEILGDLTEKY